MSQLTTSPQEQDVEDAVLAVAPFAQDERRLGFWRQPWVQSFIPWFTSLTMHIVIIAVALALLASGVFEDIIQKVTQQQVNLPTANLAQEDIGGVPNVGNMDDVTTPNAQLDPVEQTRNPLPQGEGDNFDALMEAGGGNSASVSGITGMSSLAEALGGAGGGEGSNVFGEPGGGGKFMGFDFGKTGDGGAVTRVVFICDSSGSMDGEPKLLLVEELRKTVDALRPIQFYNVLFFSDAAFHGCFEEGLRSANPSNKGVTHEFLDRLVVRGGTNPLPALEAAFRMKPQLIFFLTDGRFETVRHDEVQKTVDQLNADNSVMINTIQFMNRDQVAEDLLREIAAKHGGQYRFVGRDDLRP